MKAMKGAKAMSAGGLYSAISSKTGQKPKDVKAVFTALQGIATSEVAKTEKFAIPQLVMIKLKHKAARPAGKRMMFGKEVKVAAVLIVVLPRSSAPAPMSGGQAACTTSR